ncbi:uncharacterized protein MELLADRAFT_92025 [Melampsora larici-populina 98AG31]|uniref:Uncharacterized protein n=1 Tax=Melampsora larici-populina (strain 98AG31 / pathotype 3-4-7) TaxID=747676 RepID=F4S195_MELLP|nr:uncharacterized protein MELLADRAFT_92025 [Melampsora larici-populina 98AG31]EGG01601.1 hypothetical protein MELLADRAFT_92025 [Melampsora larici-populina 98AG31]
MPYNTCTNGRGGGRVGAETNRSRSDSRTSSSSSRLYGSTEDEDHNPPTQTQTAPGKRKKKTPLELPTIHNYHEIGLEWGQIRSDRILSRRRGLKTRTPPAILFEAQSLQAQYNLDKTMLCIAEGISKHTLDASLNEGPLAREPNKYTNYQSCSIVSTTTPMPPKGQSAGFKQRNKTVGNAWTAFADEQKDVFTPPLFDQLVQEVMREDHPTDTSTPDPTSTIPTPNDLQPLSLEEKANVNAQKIEKVGIEEIKKVVQQLQIINNKFKFHFHLLVATWNPNETGTRALYQDEFTSSKYWAVHARDEFHLLERFALEATQATFASQRSKKKSTDSTPQTLLRKELITRLNGLIEAHLPGGRQTKTDTHPQTPNPQETLKTRTYRGDIQLKIQRQPDSRVTDEMLARGSAAGRLSDDKVKIWIEDILAKRYLVVKASTPVDSNETQTGGGDHTTIGEN